ncbi:MAG: AbrB/MazE/SpoVT family DNA-binding domain-containing protein [Clostridiales bacterium]|jgi:transcriptional pleiotropic regulator of transition state genes|nr:AbrB/MazE/SpoVT family DNA-binding domain-containing protein [Clostridiales bacterium]NLL87279.1 AbrB/MazE/SpoVT family DNA-binding domain-containing protein [Syntrophomonadaceae bacterium]
MKSTGVVRRVDELGRIVIPMELRKTLNIVEKDPLEIFVAEDMIILKKYSPGCIFCGSMENVQQFRDKKVCRACLRDIQGKAV